MQIKHLFIFAAMASGIAPAVAAESALPVYLDKTKPIEQRVEDALSRMTLEEKVALCHAQGKFSSPGVRRLGIPEIWMSDGPHGVRAEINWNDWKIMEPTISAQSPIRELKARVRETQPPISMVLT